MMIRPHLFEVTILSLVIFAFIGSSANAEEKFCDKDILTLTLLKDVQDHVLYVRLLESDESELRDLLIDNLNMKLFDLNHYLAESKNNKVLKLVCDASNNLDDAFKKITRRCEDASTKKICEEAYHLSRLCVAKRN